VSQRYNSDAECYKQLVILVSIHDQKIIINNTNFIVANVTDVMRAFKQKRYIDGVKKINTEILNRYTTATFLYNTNNPYIQNVTQLYVSYNAVIPSAFWIVVGIVIIINVLVCFCCYYCMTLRNCCCPCCAEV
jgi:hypothetical protein